MKERTNYRRHVTNNGGGNGTRYKGKGSSDGGQGRRRDGAKRLEKCSAQCSARSPVCQPTATGYRRCHGRGEFNGIQSIPFFFFFIFFFIFDFFHCSLSVGQSLEQLSCRHISLEGGIKKRNCWAGHNGG